MGQSVHTLQWHTQLNGVRRSLFLVLKRKKKFSKRLLMIKHKVTKEFEAL